MKPISLSKHMSGGLGNHGKPVCSWNPERAEVSDQSSTLSSFHRAHCVFTVVLIPLTSVVSIFALKKEKERKTSWFSSLCLCLAPCSHPPLGEAEEGMFLLGPWEVGCFVHDAPVPVLTDRGSTVKDREGQARAVLAILLWVTRRRCLGDFSLGSLLL